MSGWGETEDTLPSIEDLTGPQRDPAEVRDEIKRSPGIGVPRRRWKPPAGPDVSGLAEDLGLA
jgi:hypothetical protein